MQVFLTFLLSYTTWFSYTSFLLLLSFFLSLISSPALSSWVMDSLFSIYPFFLSLSVLPSVMVDRLCGSIAFPFERFIKFHHPFHIDFTAAFSCSSCCCLCWTERFTHQFMSTLYPSVHVDALPISSRRRFTHQFMSTLYPSVHVDALPISSWQHTTKTQLMNWFMDTRTHCCRYWHTNVMIL